MPRSWALSDLHLSTSGAKPMDIFGDHWDDHAGQMAANWDAVVGDDDIVLTPGDFSWANKPAEAAGDLAWLGARPGHKILVKGNHDHWWPSSQAKLTALLPAKTHELKKTACVVHGVGFFGARGGDFAPATRYGDERTLADIDAWLDREEHELRLSITALDAMTAQDALSPHGPRICLFHYPPIPPGRQSSRFTALIREAGASHCIYGHLHGREVGATKVEGTFDGVTYRCTSCDQIGFAPTLVMEVPPLVTAPR